MNTALVWILVSVGGYNGNQLVYSPNFTDQATCEAVKKSAEDSINAGSGLGHRYSIRAQCIKVAVVR